MTAHNSTKPTAAAKPTTLAEAFAALSAARAACTPLRTAHGLANARACDIYFPLKAELGAGADAHPAVVKAERAETRACRKMMRAEAAMERAARDLERLPAATTEEALAKVVAVLDAYGSGLDRRGRVIVTGRTVDIPDDGLASLLGAVIADLRRIATTPPPPKPGEAEFLAVAEAYTAATERRDAVEAEFEAAEALVKQLAPCPPILDLGAGRSLFDEERIDEHHGGDKAAMKAALNEWRRAKAAAWATTAFDGSDSYAPGHPVYEADVAHFLAFDALLTTRAPTPAAMAFKIRATIERAWCEQIGDSADRPETLARLLAEPHFDSGMTTAWFYQDALTVAGIDSPLRDVKPWSPEAEIDAWESAPGYYYSIHTGFSFDALAPGAGEDGAARRVPRLDDWQRKAMNDAAQRRAAPAEESA